jgi:hypothetical protein
MLISLHGRLKLGELRLFIPSPTYLRSSEAARRLPGRPPLMAVSDSNLILPDSESQQFQC